MGAAGVDLVDEVLHADDAVLTQLLLCIEGLVVECEHVVGEKRVAVFGLNPTTPGPSLHYIIVDTSSTGTNLLDEGVIGDGEALLVHLGEATLVDQLADRLWSCLCVCIYVCVACDDSNHMLDGCSTCDRLVIMPDGSRVTRGGAC